MWEGARATALHEPGACAGKQRGPPPLPLHRQRAPACLARRRARGMRGPRPGQMPVLDSATSRRRHKTARPLSCVRQGAYGHPADPTDAPTNPSATQRTPSGRPNHPTDADSQWTQRAPDRRPIPTDPERTPNGPPKGPPTAPAGPIRVRAPLHELVSGAGPLPSVKRQVVGGVPGPLHKDVLP